MLTCNITYYNEPKWLIWWFRTIRTLNDRGINIQLSVCDDGSQDYPAEKVFDKHHPLGSMKLYRITKDHGFNSHGARNLLMQQTNTGWNLLSDIDRHYSFDGLTTLFYGKHELFKRGNFYVFKEATKNSDDGFSINEYVVNKKDFWKSGGYDEEFTNIHWGDRLFLQSLAYTSRRVPLPDVVVKYMRGARMVTWEDVPTTQYPDDRTLIHPNNRWTNPEFRKNLIEMVKTRNSTHEGRMSKKVINFEWEQVF